jgi:Tfp pilus assembly protein PilX
MKNSNRKGLVEVPTALVVLVVIFLGIVAFHYVHKEVRTFRNTPTVVAVDAAAGNALAEKAERAAKKAEARKAEREAKKAEKAIAKADGK